ncbi:MAG TPA: acyl carrier protein [Caldithrix abyssi]|uniref:Acyl carrier protein n=1 Tax=Caldithrix abyssi TaxID=187145 RepID=A0A7V1PUH1_CALAY|nr:acyl carrier protein [Caldithrix abyssi]
MKEKIIEFLYDDSLKDEFNDLDHDDSLLELGIIDSVKMMEMISFLEENFGIEVDDEELMPENFDSINAIVAFIESKKG